MNRERLRAKVEAKIKEVAYNLIAGSYDMEEPELLRTEQEMQNILDMQKDG